MGDGRRIQGFAVHDLILIGPAGLPLTKPLWASAFMFICQVVRGYYPLGQLGRALADTARAPRAALRIAKTVHDLDLEPDLVRLREQQVPCTVIGCATDRLTTPAHCCRLSSRLGARYRELQASGGHVWMIKCPRLLAAELAAAK